MFSERHYIKSWFFYETKAKHFCKEITVISRYYHTDTIPMFAYEIVKQSDTAFTHSEKPATFPGGEEAMVKYMITNIIYPRQAERKEIEGKVTIQFYVSQTGKKYNYSVLRRADESLVAEALRVIQKMPDWEPGLHEGKPVLYKINVPVNFKLPK